MKTYSVTLSDLIDIADAAADMDAMKSHLVDQPDQLRHIAARARKLHDIVERAAIGAAARIYPERTDEHA